MSDKRMVMYSIAIIGFVSLLMIGISFSSSSLQSVDESPIGEVSNNNDPEISSNSGAQQPLTMQMSGIVEELTDDDLEKQSNVIISGTVKEILPSKWNTPNGERPNKSLDDLDVGGTDVIYTDIVIQVDQYLKNPLDSKEVTVRVLGGTVNNDVLEVEDSPNFKQNEKVFLYLVGKESPFEVTGLFQGKFQLTDDGMARRPDKVVNVSQLPIP